MTDHIDTLRRIIDNYGVNLFRADSGAEDLKTYLDGTSVCGEWAAVTASAGDSGEVVYVYPYYDTRDDAIERATRYMDDDILQEMPRAVVNLDTGETWTPDWAKLPWMKEEDEEK